MASTVLEWQLYLDKLYAPINAQRSNFEIFARLQEHLGMLSKVSTLRTGAARLRNQTVAPGARGTAQYFIGRSLGWYFAVANKCGTNVIDVIWAKYPGICPYCRQAVCRCHELDDLPPFEAGYVREVAACNRSTFIPDGYSLDRWRQHFARIYRINRKFPPEQIFLHLLEELSEVAEAIRLPGQEYVHDELADIFAWMMAVCGAIRMPDGAVQAALEATYGSGCPACGNTPCNCVVRAETRRAAGRRVPEIPAPEMARIEEATRRPPTVPDVPGTLIDDIYRSPYNKKLNQEEIGGQVAKSSASVAQFTRAAVDQAEGVLELPGDYERRVAVLGEFKVFQDMKVIAKAVAARGYLAVTSITIFEKIAQTDRIKETPFRAHPGMGMLEFLNRFIMNCKYAINLYTHDAGNLIESQWCYEKHKRMLGICFTRSLRTDPCCEFFLVEGAGNGTCTYQGDEGSMYCVKQTCPFTKHDMSKMVLDQYVGHQPMKLAILDDWDKLAGVLDRFLAKEKEAAG